MNAAEVQSAVHVIIFSIKDSFLTRLQLSYWNLVVKLLNLGGKADFSNQKCIRPVQSLKTLGAQEYSSQENIENLAKNCSKLKEEEMEGDGKDQRRKVLKKQENKESLVWFVCKLALKMTQISHL